MGGATAMAVSGLKLRNNVNGRVDGFHEDRFDVLLLIGDPGNRGFMPDAPWRAISIPTLIVTGTNDRGQEFNESRMKFEFADPASISDTPNHYLFITDMDHYLGGLVCRSDVAADADYDAFSIASGVSTAYLDAYMRNDDQAARFLDGDDMQSLTDGRASLEIR